MLLPFDNITLLVKCEEQVKSNGRKASHFRLEVDVDQTFENYTALQRIPNGAHITWGHVSSFVLSLGNFVANASL